MAKLTTADILSDLAIAANLIAQLQTLVPQLEANYAIVKAALSTDDDAAVRAQIDTLHTDTNALTAKFKALKAAPTDA